MSFDKLTLIERNTRYTNDNVKKLTSGSTPTSLVYSNFEKLKNEANDLITALNYADPNDTALRKVTNIVYSSVLLGLTVTETFGYTLSGAGDYYVTEITLS